MAESVLGVSKKGRQLLHEEITARYERDELQRDAFLWLLE